MAQDPGDIPESAGRREPFPVEVTNVWFPEAVAKDGLRKNGAWLPIYVELKNLTGREEHAKLEVSAKSLYDKENAQTFVVRKTADVPPGAPRRVWINMRAAPSDQQLISLTVSVVREARGSDGKREVIVHRQDLGSADCHDLSGGGGKMIAGLLVGSNLTKMIPRRGWFRLSQFGNQSAMVQDYCGPSALPDTFLGYQPFDVVVVRDIGEERLEPAQITALRHWVFMGGFVVLAASTQGGDLFHTDLARTLLGDHYVEPTSTVLTIGEDLPAGAVVTMQHDVRHRSFGAPPSDVLVKLREMQSIESEPFAFVDPVTDDLVSKVGSRTIHMLSEDESLVIEDEKTSIRMTRSSILEGARRLYVEFRSGRGRVGVVTFDDQTFGSTSESTFLAPVWKRIIGSSHGGSPLSTEAAAFAKNKIVDKLRDPERDIGFSFIVALVVIYLLLIGPGIYFFLKRLDRLPWLIWVEPLVVLFYLAVVIVAGYVSKGAITKAREWTLISQRVGDDLAVRESYLAVFAGAERSYQIGSSAGVLLTPVFANQSEAAKALGGGAKDGKPSLVLEEDSTGHRRLTGLHLQQWEEGYAVNLDVMEVDPDGGIQVEVLGEIRDRGEATDETNTLQVRLANRLPYEIRSGIYVHPTEGEFLLPAVDAGATVEVRLDRRRDDGPQRPENLSRLFELRTRGFSPHGGRPDIFAVLDRPDADYDEEWHTNLRERLDLFLLYRTE